MPEELINKNGSATWELDRKVPVAIILTIIIQFVLGIWYFSKLDSRVNFLESQVILNQTQVASLNIAREATAIAQTKQEDKSDQMYNMLRALINRSTNLHPEFQDDPKLKSTP